MSRPCPVRPWAVAIVISVLLIAIAVAAAAAARICTKKTGGQRRPACGGAALQLAETASIPKIIHQVWLGSPLPPKYNKHIQSWKDLNPDFEHRLYDDKSAEALIREHYPGMLAQYLAFQRPVQRADMLRYLAVHRSGGFYADVDTTCRKPLAPLCGHRCVVGTEIQTHRGPEQYLQWFFGAAPQHPLMMEVMAQVRRRLQDPKVRKLHPDMQVLAVTGPRAFTEAVNRTLKQDPSSIEIFDHCTFGMYNIHLFDKCQKKAYLTHHFEGEWKMHWPDHLKNY